MKFKFNIWSHILFPLLIVCLVLLPFGYKSSAQQIQTTGVYNVSMTSGSQEYSQALPPYCKGFEVQMRTAVNVQMAFVSGTSNTTYFTIKSGTVFTNHFAAPQANTTIYLYGGGGSAVAEIVYWM